MSGGINLPDDFNMAAFDRYWGNDVGPAPEDTADVVFSCGHYGWVTFDEGTTDAEKEEDLKMLARELCEVCQRQQQREASAK